jgi:hypothetical protein
MNKIYADLTASYEVIDQYKFYELKGNELLV